MSINPQSALACLDRGLVWRKKDELDRGISDYDRAMSINPQYAVAYLDLGLARGKRDELDRAIAGFDQTATSP